jgi:hypothetical protein
MSQFLRQHAVALAAVFAAALIAPVAASADGLPIGVPSLPVPSVPSVPAVPATAAGPTQTTTVFSPARASGHAKCPALAKAMRARRHGKKPGKVVCKVQITRRLADTLVNQTSIQRNAPVTDSGCLPGERLNVSGTVRDSLRIWTSNDGTMFVSDDHWYNVQGTGTNAAGQVVASYNANEENLSQQKFDATGGAMAQFVFNHHVIRQGETADGMYVNPADGSVTYGDDLHEHSETHMTLDPLTGDVNAQSNDYDYCN